MKRIFACLIFVAVFPLLASLTHNQSANPTPFVTVAFAGHTSQGGGYCECDSADCECDPGERPGGQSNSAVTSDDSLNQVASPVSDSSDPGFDFGSGALLLALALFVWT